LLLFVNYLDTVAVFAPPVSDYFVLDWLFANLFLEAVDDFDVFVLLIVWNLF